eukprot:gene6536-7209_t
MSYPAYPRDYSSCLRRRVGPYGILSTLLFLFTLWYIFDPFSTPLHSPSSSSSSSSSDSSRSSPSEIRLGHGSDHSSSSSSSSTSSSSTSHTIPDSHLCNEDDAIKYTLSGRHGARCMDGSLPAFYWKKGSHNSKDKWLVHFEGGGWCFDPLSCQQRSRGVYGSSKDYPTCLSKDSMKHYLSSQASANPMMSHWNIIRVRYCDGGSYAGNTALPIPSQYDHWQINHIYGGERNDAGHGVFIESCAHHCVSCSDSHEDTWNGKHIVASIYLNTSSSSSSYPIDRSLYSPGEAFKAWYARSINGQPPPDFLSERLAQEVVATSGSGEGGGGGGGDLKLRRR